MFCAPLLINVVARDRRVCAASRDECYFWTGGQTIVGSVSFSDTQCAVFAGAGDLVTLSGPPRLLAD